MKRCELCNSPARMYCESDQASLCWKCDSKIHGANFLVARHRRSLLCNVCQSPTPWSSSGADFGPTVSVCRRCAADKIRRAVAFDEIEDRDEDDDEMTESDEEDGEIEVVPWPSTPPPPETSCSSGEAYSSRQIPKLKRVRESSSDLSFQEDVDVERWSKRKDVGSAFAGAN